MTDVVNTVYVTATATEGQVASSASATVTVAPLIPNPSLLVTKTIATASGACGASSNHIFLPGSSIYYCFSIRNTGNTNFERFTFQDLNLGFYNGTVAITPPLRPGQQVRITDRKLAALGPITPTMSVTNTLVVTGSGPLGEATSPRSPGGSQGAPAPNPGHGR